MQEIRYLELGDLSLESGEMLTNARLAYATYGSLSPDRRNCVLLPTYYTGTHASYEPLVGAGRALDPERWFVVVPNLFGNGVSSSPSRAGDPSAQRRFPRISVADNVNAQRRLIAHLGVEGIAVVGGWSLGAIHSYHWAAMFPDLVDGLLPFCGTASCWPLNRTFLGGLRMIVAADPAFADPQQTVSCATLRAFGRVYAGWAYSARFYRDELYRGLGFETLEAFLSSWEEEHAKCDAFDLLAVLWTWEHADIGMLPGCAGDSGRALARIRARAIVMPCDEDRYFAAEEAEWEAQHLTEAEVRLFHSPYGHCAGAPGRFPEESATLAGAFRDLLRVVRGTD